MTNEVEKLILINNNEDSKLNSAQKVTYLFYKEIWKFLLFVNNYDYNVLNIQIDIFKNNDSYLISDKFGIRYQLIGSNFKTYYNTYYIGCNKDGINSVLNADIDLRLLYKLLYLDGFDYDYLSDDDNFKLYININKYNVRKVIESVMIKNKILKKEL